MSLCPRAPDATSRTRSFAGVACVLALLAACAGANPLAARLRRQPPDNMPSAADVERALGAGRPASCEGRTVHPPKGGRGWHRVQYELELAYCGLAPGTMYRGMLRPGARQVTENHYAGALFTALYAEGRAAEARRWLSTQLAEGHQGSEQAGGYTNFYRADVLAGLRWALTHGDADLAGLARRWLEQSYALDLLHTVPGSFTVAIPAARHKGYILDGRQVTLGLLAGEIAPREVLRTKRWQYPAYNDVRWLADALLAGHLEPWPWAAEWALRRDRAAVARLRVVLDGMRLRSPLVWVLLDSGGWYSYARDGMAQSWPPTTDAVSVTPAGEVTRLGWSRRAGSPEVLVSPRRLAVRRDREERELALPAGHAALRLEIGAPSGNP